MSAALLVATATAFALGVRHGLDWDHLSAIADLAGPGGPSRHSFGLAFWYCLGHCSVIVLLGLLVALVGVRLPGVLDRIFETLVGLTLVGLGGLVLAQVLRQGRDYRFTSRWRLVLDILRRVRPHRHGATASHQPSAGLSGRLAFSIGLLHGVGAETPTQIVLFASAAAAGSAGGALLVLGSFVAGLMASDLGVALAWLQGRAGSARLPFGQLALGVATGIASIGVGSALILARSAALPSLFGG